MTEDEAGERCNFIICKLLILGSEMAGWHQGDGDICGVKAREFQSLLREYKAFRVGYGCFLTLEQEVAKGAEGGK